MPFNSTGSFRGGKPLWFVLTCCSLFLAACAGETLPPQPELPRFEPGACPSSVPTSIPATCGALVVAADRSQPDRGELRLTVIVFPSLAEAPAPDPVVYLAGGPGVHVLESAIELLTTYASFLQTRDLILLDQRGVGVSRPSLDCPEDFERALELASRDLDDDSFLEQTLAAREACRTRLVAEGAQLNAFHSAASAADLEDLRIVLGIEQWNLFGVSYGSRLALTALRDHPQGVRSVILDSVYPPQVDLVADTPVNAQRALEVLFAGCQADLQCRLTFPDFEADFYALVEKLNERPIFVPIFHPVSGEALSVSIDGDDLVGLYFEALYEVPKIRLLPRLVHDIEAESYQALSGLIRDSLQRYQFVSEGMNRSVQCFEEIGFSKPEAVDAGAQGVHPAVRPYFDRLARLAFATCEMWGAGAAGAVENQPVTSDIPALILSGEYDPITPPAWGALAAETLPNAFVFELTGLGHGVVRSSNCGQLLALAFIDDPSRPPDASCLDSLGPPLFAIR